VSEDSSSSSSSDSSGSSDSSNSSEASADNSSSESNAWSDDSAPATQPADVEPPEMADVPPPPEQPEPGEPLEHIVDDVEPRAEAHAWAYGEMKRGRPGEEVHADLVARGWDWDDAEGLVESARKSHGALDAVANAPLPPLRFRGISGMGGRLINFIVGIFVAIFHGQSAVQEEMDRRRYQPATSNRCIKCGFQLPDGQITCPNCGTEQPRA
jgi:hypothetical protein